MSRVPGLSKERLPVPSAAPGAPLPGFNAPRTFEKRSRRRGGSTRCRPITHRRSAGRSRGLVPRGPSWCADGESQVLFGRRSRRRRPPTPSLRSSHLRPRGPPTKPRAGRAAFHPHCSRAGDGKHERTNPASPRTLCTQWGRTGGGRSPPIATVQVRCPTPEAWLLPIGLGRRLPSNQTAPRAPHTPGHPSAWEAGASEENRPMDVSAGHVCPLLEVPGNHFRPRQNVYSVTRGNGSQDNAFFTLFPSTTGGHVGSHFSATPSPPAPVTFLFDVAFGKREICKGLNTLPGAFG